MKEYNFFTPKKLAVMFTMWALLLLSIWAEGTAFATIVLSLASILIVTGMVAMGAVAILLALPRDAVLQALPKDAMQSMKTFEDLFSDKRQTVAGIVGNIIYLAAFASAGWAFMSAVMITYIMITWYIRVKIKEFCHDVRESTTPESDGEADASNESE
jgi:hypothetical protein